MGIKPISETQPRNVKHMARVLTRWRHYYRYVVGIIVCITGTINLPIL